MGFNSGFKGLINSLYTASEWQWSLVKVNSRSASLRMLLVCTRSYPYQKCVACGCRTKITSIKLSNSHCCSCYRLHASALWSVAPIDSFDLHHHGSPAQLYRSSHGGVTLRPTMGVTELLTESATVSVKEGVVTITLVCFYLSWISGYKEMV